MATLDLEGPDTGWVGTAGFDEAGEFRVLETRETWGPDVGRLLSRLLQEPSPSGRVPGAYVSLAAEDDAEELLYDLASSVMRRRPEVRGERLTGYVSGGSRFVDTPDADIE